MLNHQIKTQNIAFFATFLLYNRRKPSSEDEKRDLPMRTGPFHYIRVMITSQRLPVRRLTDIDNQLLTDLV